MLDEKDTKKFIETLNLFDSLDDDQKNAIESLNGFIVPSAEERSFTSLFSNGRPIWPKIDCNEKCSKLELPKFDGPGVNDFDDYELIKSEMVATIEQLLKAEQGPKGTIWIVVLAIALGISLFYIYVMHSPNLKRK